MLNLRILMKYKKQPNKTVLCGMYAIYNAKI